MISAAGFVQYGLDSVERLFLIYVTTPVHQAYGWLRMAAYGAAHLFMSFVFAVFTITVSLRLFGTLCRRMHFGDELKKGNVAVGILLAGALFVICRYVGDGVGSLSKALLPQPSIGRVQIMK
jgi:accessory gene regulator protein AgrB